MAVDFTKMGADATIYDVDQNQPYIVMVRGANYREKNTDLPDKSTDRGYRAVNLWFSVMSGNIIGQDFWQMILYDGTGTNAAFKNQWPYEARKKLAIILGRPVRSLPSVEGETGTDLDNLIGCAFMGLLRVRKGTKGYADTLEVNVFLEHVDPTDIPVTELVYTDTTVDEINVDDLA